MADKRKLQGEIDRCHKKVGEGVDSFKETWKKLQQASNPNQKEKYEQDLKKEIKKLQRLRDQIKTWCASNEVKDKRILLEDRRLIETQMETFKVVERETKTKAYSKEALGLPAKIDPAEKERCHMRDWLNEVIDKINVEIDKVECDIETMQAQNKKGKSKDKNNEALQEQQGHLNKHRWHIANLEALLRMLDNNTLEIKELKNITESIEYYITDYKEPDFIENEYIYSDIVDMDIVSTCAMDSKLSGTQSDNDDDDSVTDDVTSYPVNDTPHDTMDHVPPSPNSKSNNNNNNSNNNKSKSNQQSHPVSTRSRNPTPNNSSSNSSTNSSSNTNCSSGSSIPAPVPSAGYKTPSSSTKPSANMVSPPGIIPISQTTNIPPTHSMYTTISNTDNMRSPPLTQANISPPMAAPMVDDNQEAFVLDPILGVSPLGPCTLTPERMHQLEMIEAAGHNLPLPTDTCRLRPMNWIYASPDTHTPIPTHHLHSYDPKQGFDTFEYFKNLAPDTLFFIFYFYEGTRAQFYAAKALKEQHWRFHKKFKMWFQRYEEPKEITKTYETGTYVYFDFNEWQQRTKEDFTFEYKYLEENNLED